MRRPRIRRKPYAGRLRFAGTPRPGDLIVYRTGPLLATRGMPLLLGVVVYSRVKGRDPFDIVWGTGQYTCVSGSPMGPRSDRAKSAPGTWRWPRDEWEVFQVHDKRWSLRTPAPHPKSIAARSS